MTTQMTREEALAEAWASMDGKLEHFRAGKGDRSLDVHGHYRGYLAEAHELIARLEQRGYTVTPTHGF